MSQPKVLIIYTGGTIGMINDPQTGALKPFDFAHIYNHVPELKQFRYEIKTWSFEKPMDSSEVNPETWTLLAKKIAENYSLYDGFVILHGTDTMAYTASALSFMLQGIRKPVILTGSQLPIGQIRTDGKENLITSIEIAGLKGSDGMPVLQEVALYFEFCLMRGNRTEKVNAENFEAFKSYNYPLLAEAGVHILFSENLLWRTKFTDVQLFTDFEPRIGLISIFPGMPVEPLAAILDLKHSKGVIIETFGSGNTFTSPELRKMLSSYLNSGGIVLNTTQCHRGSVELGKYQTSQVFVDLEVTSGLDLTRPAAITKMMYALGKARDKQECISILKTDLAGELTNPTH